MQNKFWILALLAAGSVMGAEYAPVKNPVQQVYVYQPEKYALRQGALLSNQFARYELTLTQTKSDGKTPPKTSYTLNAGKFGFSPLVEFCKLTVNGIPLSKLSPKAEDLTPWRNGKEAGADLKLNFDGAKVILRFYLRPDSPVLWGSLLPDKSSVEKIERAQLEFSLIPSLLRMKNKQVIWQGGYARMAVTPARTIAQNAQNVVLTAQDTELTIQDGIQDGSAADKGQGPCWIQLDYGAIAKAELRVNDDWTSALYLTLKADFKEVNFALWQQATPISNADFARKLKAEKKAFTR